MSVHKSKDFLTWVAVQKTAGQATPTVGSQFSFPVGALQPRNPVNFTYPAVINSQGAPSVKVQGKKTPSVTIVGLPLKTSWWTGATGLNFVSDLIAASTSFLDSNNNSSEYAIGVGNSSTVIGTQVYDGGKCMQMSLYETAPGGGVTLDMGFLARYGDSEASVPTTFSTPSTDAGSLIDVSNVDFNSTADGVESWRLTLMRPQAYTMYCDGTIYSDALQSGAFGGTFTLTQASLATTIPSTTVTIKIGTTPNGISLVLNMQLDERVYDRAPSLGVITRTYSLIKSTAGYPITISTF